MIKLGVNIDHVATLRQVRRATEPDILQAALEAIKGGADGITIHLREDRRHIQDQDVFAISKKIRVPLNLEMSLAPEIVRIALDVNPEKVCLVPERRQELTTEGGLAVSKEVKRVSRAVSVLTKRGIVVSLFIAPSEKEVRAAYQSGAQYVEFHTGEYAHAQTSKARARELVRLKQAAVLAHSLGLGVNAGHGLNYQNVQAVCQVPHLDELNIGHSIVSRAVFTGLRSAVSEMKPLIRKSS
ncbi:MAG: pyridoxine 5'-phosphate synthase [Candidatus Omnitrophica bacterium]|nr:pyridoxine 5'-phosphate synthase [Candidatus Omnitrophota bacterium]